MKFGGRPGNGLSRLFDATGHSAEPLRKPRVVYPIHPVSGRDFAGPAEGLLTFQTLVTDLTGLPVANASLLDEATAAEAMTMCHGIKQGEPRNRFFVSDRCHPQNLDVLRTRARPLGIEVLVGDAETSNLTRPCSACWCNIRTPTAWLPTGDR